MDEHTMRRQQLADAGSLPVLRPGPAADDPLDADDPLLSAIHGLSDARPERRLWPAIEARVAPRSGTRRSVTFTLPQLAMAATLLIAVSGGVSWLALQPRNVPSPAPELAIRAVAEPAAAIRADVERASFADAQYDAAVADLESILREQSEQLDPQTVMVIERSLQAIDEAIRQSRAALDADPANTYLNSHLADARRRKLDLLRRAAGLSSGGD
jgi:hypothetical protein